MVHLINRKRFILNNIDSLLNNELSPTCIEKTLKLQPLQDLLNMLRKESLDAIESLKSFQYEIPPQDFHQLSQQNYSDLFRMKDRFNLLQASGAFKNLSEEALSFYQVLGITMDSVAHSLESIGICKLAPHELLPDHFRECRKAALLPTCLLLLSRFKLKYVDPGLTELLRAHFNAFNSANRIMQHELCFIEQLITSLINLFDVPQDENYNARIMNELIRLNFNSGEALSYFIRKLKADLDESNGSKRKFQALNWQLKELKQLLPVTGLALNPAYPELKVLLLELVQAEISYLERSMSVAEQSLKTIYNQRRPSSSDDGKGSRKIQLQLTQRVLAIWAQTMISLNLIKLGIKGQREFTEFLAEHFTTAGSEDIRTDCFRRRYKEKHTVGSESLIAILEKMISYIKQEYIEIKIPSEK